MARKVLISFIGTGRLKQDPKQVDTNKESREYDKTVYFFKGQKQETSFISAALGEFLNIDTYFLFGTMHSMWEAVYEYFAGKKGEVDEDYSFQLYETCEKANHNTEIDKSRFNKLESALGNGSIVTPIYYGIYEEEIRKNFEIFSKILEENLIDGDEVYLDITHSFRSLPLFATTALSFITDVSDKKIHFKGIYYGMLEVKRDFNNEVPVVNLSYINQLQEWIKGAYAFSRFGNSSLIADLMSEKNQTISKILEEFSNTIEINFAHEIRTQVSRLITLTNENSYQLPEKLIIPKTIKEFTKFFEGKNTLSEYQFRLSQWHQKIGNIGLSYLCLVEAIITYVCEKQGWDEKNEENRNNAKKNIVKENIFGLKEIFDNTNEVRKRIAHVLDKQQSKKINFSKAVSNLKKYQRDFEKILKSNKNE